MSDRASHRGPESLARALRERLELNRSFGWEMPVRPSSVEDDSGSSRESPRDASSQVAAPQSGATTVGQSTASAEERARREALLETIRHQVAACTDCTLSRSRTQTVPGVGDPCARLMFIGEAPGFDEDRVGEPFVGKAGKLLDKIILAMRMRRDWVYIANIVKCRPPHNRTPDVGEIASCMPYLTRQIEIVRPEVICLLGSVAARALLETSSAVGSLRGRFHDYHGIPVRVTYHPAYLLRSPHEKRKTWDDVQTIMGLLGV